MSTVIFFNCLTNILLCCYAWHTLLRVRKLELTRPVSESEIELKSILTFDDRSAEKIDNNIRSALLISLLKFDPMYNRYYVDLGVLEDNKLVDLVK